VEFQAKQNERTTKEHELTRTKPRLINLTSGWGQQQPATSSLPKTEPDSKGDQALEEGWLMVGYSTQ
jgi:hypothetical protein